MSHRLVVGVCLLLVLAACGEDAESTTTTAVSTTTTVTTAAGVGTSWERAPDEQEAFGGTAYQEMMAVTEGGPGLVAVGWQETDSQKDAAVWTSEDGSNWLRVPFDETTFGGAFEQMMTSVVAAGPGLVAVGWTSSEVDVDAGVWTSADGLTWSPVPADPVALGGPDWQGMNSVTVGGPGLVAVGFEWSEGERHAAVWTSVDGLAWTRVPHDEAVFDGPGEQMMNAVTAGGPGLVAVGLESSYYDAAAAVWTSADGLVWTRVPHDEAVFGGPSDQTMRSVTTSWSGLVAAGGDESGVDMAAAVWTSPDGLVWTRVPHDEAVFGGPDWQRINSVVASGTLVVAVGFDWSGGDLDGAAWASSDGVIWWRVPHDEAAFGGTEDQRIEYAVAWGSGVVAVGWTGSAAGHRPAVWLARPAD
ncbi:MAG: hypothetical protein QY307_07420 [Acidimicrobiia bacterium]|nr:MAG: hypothetical protein QY307_07420 [Acidimicrobiia bacterium]